MKPEIWLDLKHGITYVKENGIDYEIIDYINKKYREREKMKIKSWEELDNECNGNFTIHYKDYVISVIACTSVSTMQIGILNCEDVLQWLKLFGFGIEFEEPPKLSMREYHYVNYMPKDVWLARDFKGLFSYDSKPYKTEISGEWEWEDDSDYECGAIYGEDLFLFITPDRAWSVKELRELEVVDEP